MNVLRIVNQEKLADGTGDTQRGEDDEESPAGGDSLEALAEAEEKRQDQAREKGDELQNSNAVSVGKGRHGELFFFLFLFRWICGGDISSGGT